MRCQPDEFRVDRRLSDHLHQQMSNIRQVGWHRVAPFGVVRVDDVAVGDDQGLIVFD